MDLFEQANPGDRRPRDCIAAIRRFVEGGATEEELAAASAAARAAWAAARAAWANWAAWASASAAARDAASAAAWDVAWPDAVAAAWDAWTDRAAEMFRRHLVMAHAEAPSPGNERTDDDGGS